jgi:hypothetical protein
MIPRLKQFMVGPIARATLRTSSVLGEKVKKGQIPSCGKCFMARPDPIG